MKAENILSEISPSLFKTCVHFSDRSYNKFFSSFIIQAPKTIFKFFDQEKIATI